MCFQCNRSSTARDVLALCHSRAPIPTILGRNRVVMQKLIVINSTIIICYIRAFVVQFHNYNRWAYSLTLCSPNLPPTLLVVQSKTFLLILGAARKNARIGKGTAKYLFFLRYLLILSFSGTSKLNSQDLIQLRKFQSMWRKDWWTSQNWAEVEVVHVNEIAVNWDCS